MNKKNHLDYLSFARVFAIYWVVLIQHNFAPFHPDWGWVDCSGYPSYFDQLSPFTQLITLLSMPLCFLYQVLSLTIVVNSLKGQNGNNIYGRSVKDYCSLVGSLVCYVN